MLRPGSIGKGHPDPVAKFRPIQDINVRGIEDHVSIANLDQQVRHAFVHTGQHLQLPRCGHEGAANGELCGHSSA